ncbi:sensor histidine kinase [Labilibaculum antarcticum]|uniref:histidine kinase n=1 Tax=Labilibaculum antarcticum TaxID=1717717 RepID=A0A1Y1CMS9_9BACT|nr:HAMP domain-containing sensor histidine kinase [Labilibaculum antarcticum]BAX81728.1 two-component sensor histidine kinase [Labilibaculum antarcticum]
MIKPGLKIGILLTLILVLPSLFFSAYEISNINQNEAVIDSIYSSQLESILFSVNQYSDDVISGWANQLDKGKYGLDQEMESLVTKNYSIDAFFLIDSLKHQLFSKEKIPEDSLTILTEKLEYAFAQNANEIERLQQYIKSGYQKIGVLDFNMKGKSLFAFARTVDSLSVETVLLLIDIEKFIGENLGPKIQGIAQDQFYISVIDKKRNAEIYSNVVYDEGEKNIQQRRKIWLFPAYDLGIQMKGNTIENLVRKRTRTNIIMLIVMDMILLLGAWFVYRNIRQQMKLTQIKSDFISNVSHEIRTPLALINMYSETLEMGRLPSEGKKQEYYKVINTEANRLSNMVNNILNFSKIESGKREYHFKESDINAEIEIILENYGQHLHKKGFEINFESFDDFPKLLIDKEAVSEAIINLIDNAVKYSGNTKRIEIACNTDLEFANINVIDFGIGISKKDQALIFDKFYRVSSGDLANKVKGSGIGLSIVKHIMDAHNGRITVKSSKENGTCFTLSFPLSFK